MALVLAKKEIRKLLEGKPPLIEEWVSLEDQLQPNGFDLTLREVVVMTSAGNIAVANAQRQVSSLKSLAFDAAGFIMLPAGVYLITYNEVVNLPRDVMALAAHRSSLLRCGVSIGTAVWDAGYSGRSQSLMVVHNPLGFRVQKNARMIQLVFFRLAEETEGYSGTYQRENI
jgi:dUTP pyrophosphatase